MGNSCGGCCTSADAAWEDAASADFVRYTIRRSFASASRFAIELVAAKPNSSTREATTPPPALQIAVQLFLTPNGRVHAGMPGPSEVTFGASDDALAYDPDIKRLAGVLTYQRAITASYHLCPADTIWKLDDGGNGEGAAALPRVVSVVNNDGRVAVFRGAHVGAYLPDAATRRADLIAHVPETHGSIPGDWSCDRVFELRLHPEVDASAGATPGLLPLLLAICTEGFWSQGAIGHGGIEGDYTHGGAVDKAALLESGSKRGFAARPYVLKPRSSIWPRFHKRRAG